MRWRSDGLRQAQPILRRCRARSSRSARHIVANFAKFTGYSLPRGEALGRSWCRNAGFGCNLCRYPAADSLLDQLTRQDGTTMNCAFPATRAARLGGYRSHHRRGARSRSRPHRLDPARFGRVYGRMTGPAGSGIDAVFSFQSRDHLVSGRGTSLPSTRIASTCSLKKHRRPLIFGHSGIGSG